MAGTTCRKKRWRPPREPGISLSKFRMDGEANERSQDGRHPGTRSAARPHPHHRSGPRSCVRSPRRSARMRLAGAPVRWTVVLGDDHEIVRYGMRALLRTTMDFGVVAEASDGITALAVVERHKPDLLVLDITLPELSGLDVVRETSRISPRTRTMIVSMHTGEAYAAQAFRNGASGYLRKEAPYSQLLEGLREVASGGRYLDSRLSDAVVESLLGGSEGGGLRPSAHAEHARAAGPSPDGRGTRGARHRGAPLHQHADGGEPPREHHEKAGAEEPHGSSFVRRPSRDCCGCVSRGQLFSVGLRR